MKIKKTLILKTFFILLSSQFLFNFSKANAAQEIKIIYGIFSRTIEVNSLKILKNLNNYLPNSIKINTVDENNNFSDLIMYVEPLRKFLEILQNVPGYSIDMFLKRVPRLINEPYTKEMGIKIAKKVTEKGVVRLVKIAAGANI